MDANIIEIIPFEEKYATDFYNLNVEWLEKYFYVERYDQKVLSNPKKYVIEHGGFIFFAKYNNAIVGVVGGARACGSRQGVEVEGGALHEATGWVA